MGLLEDDFPWESITVMIQKEVAQRMDSGPGSKEYGALSVQVAYYADTEILRLVKPDSFVPKPKVDSIVIRLDRLERPRVEPKDIELFFQVVRQSFAMRRKTLHNNLKPLGLDPAIVADAFQAAGIDPGRRGETLSIEEFSELSDQIKERLNDEKTD